MNLSRPQECISGLKFRTRQNNFGLIQYDFPSNRQAEWKPTPEMKRFMKKNWKCYQLKPDGTENYVWVLNLKGILDMKKKLEQCDEFALKCKSSREESRYGFLGLIVISTREFGDFLIGAAELVTEIRQHLTNLLENPSKLKILHDSEEDIKALQRDYGIFLNGVADTQIFFKEWTGDQTSLTYKMLCWKMQRGCIKYFNAQKLEDWTLRPANGLLESQERLARNDAHPLLRMFDEMRYSMPENLLEAAFIKSNNLTNVLFERPPSEILPLLAVGVEQLTMLQTSHNVVLCNRGRVKFSCLFLWRNMMAKILDKSDNQLLGPGVLFELARKESPSIEYIIGVLGRTGPLSKQKHIVQNILVFQDATAYMQKLNSLECHNCLKSGHGPAVFCPFPRSSLNFMKWMIRDENAAPLALRWQRSNLWRQRNGKDKVSLSMYKKIIRDKIAREELENK